MCCNHANFYPAGPVAAAPVVAKPTEESPKKSVETPEETPAETLESTKTDKSRSRSRGAPSNIIGFFKGKKGEKAEESKKVEEPVAAPATEEVTPETVAPTGTSCAENFYIDTANILQEPIAETVAAPVITDAIPPVEEKDEHKPNRRLSRFESFFNNKKTEKKTGEEAGPVTETAVTEPAVVETPTITEPVAETAAPVEEEAKATTPTKERKPSFLAGIQKLTQKVRSPSSEHPPALAAESSAVDETPAATEPAVEAAATEPTTEVAEELPTSPTEKAEKRRSSLFDFKKFTQKPAKITEPAVAAEEPATTEEVKAVEEAAPVVPAAVEEPVKTSSEEKAVTEKAPKEHKESPIAQLGRRFSKAIRGGAKKETKTPAKVAEDEADKVEPVSAEAPQLEKPTETPVAIGDVVPEAVHSGSAPPASTTVSATA